jgi:hypothetical protein
MGWGVAVATSVSFFYSHSSSFELLATIVVDQNLIEKPKFEAGRSWVASSPTWMPDSARRTALLPDPNVTSRCMALCGSSSKKITFVAKLVPCL